MSTPCTSVWCVTGTSCRVHSYVAACDMISVLHPWSNAQKKVRAWRGHAKQTSTADCTPSCGIAQVRSKVSRKAANGLSTPPPRAELLYNTTRHVSSGAVGSMYTMFVFVSKEREAKRDKLVHRCIHQYTWTNTALVNGSFHPFHTPDSEEVDGEAAGERRGGEGEPRIPNKTKSNDFSVRYPR